MKNNFIRIVLLLLFFSVINKAQWVALNNTFGKEIRCMVKNGNALFVGSVDGGVYVSLNSDQNWMQKNNGLTNLKIYSLAKNGSIVAAGTYGGGVFLSTDNGNNWTTAANGITVPYVYSLAFLGENLIVGTGGGGVFKGTKNGTDWSNVLPLTFLANSVFSGSSESYLGIGPYIYRSSDNGAVWNSVVASNTTIKAFAETQRSSGGTNLFVGSLDGAFLSTDNGKNWKTINSGLTYTNINSMAVSGQNVFAATENGGVFFTKDNGTSWSQINTGLPANTSVRSLVIENNIMYAAASSGIVYKRALSDVVTSVRNEISSIPKTFTLSQNFPNPFNPTTKISFSVPQKTNVSLRVYDITGKEVSVLLNQELEAGNYQTDFNASGLSSGIYLYKISADNFIQTKKMMLIK